MGAPHLAPWSHLPPPWAGPSQPSHADLLSEVVLPYVRGTREDQPRVLFVGALYATTYGITIMQAPSPSYLGHRRPSCWQLLKLEEVEGHQVMNRVSWLGRENSRGAP